MSCDAHQRAAACVCGRLETVHHSFSRWNIFFFDATQKEQAEKVRRRSANCVTFFSVPFFARMANKQKESFPRVGVNKLSKLASDKRERRELKVTDVVVTNTK